MASLDRMVAGVAPEINNAVNCIYGNIDPLDRYTQDLLNLKDCWETAIPQQPQEVKELSEAIEIDFLKEDLPKILESMKIAMEGVASIKEIVITTESTDRNWVVVRVKDNGSSITPENLDRIFESFFTTKSRGVGTGLGLAISPQIVVEKHGGKLTVTSEFSKGTEFTIALPVQSSEVTTPPTAITLA